MESGEDKAKLAEGESESKAVSCLSSPATTTLERLVRVLTDHVQVVSEVVDELAVRLATCEDVIKHLSEASNHEPRHPSFISTKRDN